MAGITGKENKGSAGLSVCMIVTAFALYFSGGVARGAGEGVDMSKMRGILTDTSSNLDKMAADTLARYLSRIYGTELPVNPEGVEVSKDTRDVILVGRKTVLAAGTITAEELEKVKHDGFVLRAGAGKISLAGYAERGSVYAAYELLEQLGCRFYSPSFEVIPPAESGIIEAFDFADKPFFQYRSGNRWAGRCTVGSLGDPRQALNPELFKDSNLWLDHTSGYLVPKLLYYDEHPEYYALRRDGTRIPKTTSDARLFLCSSHPDVIRISTERTLGWMKLQPEQRYFMISVGDGPEWCRCENCLALDRAPGNYSDRLLEYVNHIAREVKKEYPDNILITLAYIGSEYAPVEVKPESNVIVFFCPYFGIGRSMAHSFTHPLNIEALTMLEEWLDAAPGNMAVYDYNMGNTPSWFAMAEKIQWFAERGILGVWFCGRPACFQDMFNYVVDRLMWDPSLDPEGLVSDFVSAYYGPAAPYLMEYLSAVRERLKNGYPKMVYEQSMPPDYYSVEFTGMALDLFDKALDSVKEDTSLFNRVKHEKDIFLGDYRVSVNLATYGVCGRGIVRPSPTKQQRAQALDIFKKYLAEQISADEKMTAGLEEKENARLADQREKLRVRIRSQLNSFAGLAIPGDGVDIVSTAKAFIAGHDKILKEYAKEKKSAMPTERIDGGIKLAGGSFTGGMGPMSYSWYCEPRESVMILGSEKSPRSHVMHAEFSMETVPPGAAKLRIEGQNSDKDTPPLAHLTILINKKEIFSGPVDFVRRGWSWEDFTIDAGILKKGKNMVEIRNITDGRRMDHYWFALAEALILFKN